MSTVFIPTVLRPNVGGAKTLDLGGETIRGVVDELVTRHPALRQQLLTDEGDLNRFVNVYINDEDVRFIGGLDAELSDGDQVVVLPAVAGGAA